MSGAGPYRGAPEPLTDRGGLHIKIAGGNYYDACVVDCRVRNGCPAGKY